MSPFDVKLSVLDAFTLTQLAECENGLYTFDDLLLRLMRAELLEAEIPAHAKS